MLRFKPVKSLLLSILVILTTGWAASAQILEPVKWKFDSKQDGADVELIWTATVDDHWHVYAQDLPADDGPIPTSFVIESPEGGYTVKGKVKEEGNMITEYDPNFDMDLNYYEHKVTFRQKLTVTTDKDFTIAGFLEYMVCDESRCLPPEILDWSFDLKGVEGATGDVGNEDPEAENTTDATNGDPTAGGDGTGILAPVKWTFRSEKVSEGVYEAIWAATIDEGWHVYDQKLAIADGPAPTEVFVDTALLPDGHEFMGPVTAPEPHVEYDEVFKGELAWFADQVEFRQKFKVEGEPGVLEGHIYFMTCDDRRCLPPEFIDFKIDLSTGKGWNPLEDPADASNVVADSDPDALFPSELEKVVDAEAIGDCGDQVELGSPWMVFLFGLIGGLVALLTPCVFPMIPLTVSFFTKGNTEKGRGLRRAALYGFFIFMIYALLSVPFHFGAESQVLNEIATGAPLNLIFFAVFLVLAFSFFGYFELTLPSSLSNKTDKASEAGGIIGIFFMALTLAIVSFSCTGPILGIVLGNSIKAGPWPITAAFSGFGVALGLPFALFAAFPSMMNKLPQSGGWMTTLKVVLGFVELALALKFLSNADLVYQWHFIERETFFLIWIIITFGLAAYLFGLFRFPHDVKGAKLKKTRLAFATIILLFGVYLIPGVLPNPWWNHNALSGFPPPTFYSWYNDEGAVDEEGHDNHEEEGPFHPEYTNFDEAWAEVKALNKPILIDYTGWACVNCRKMEEAVWTVDSIRSILKDDVVVVSLYVDDKNDLPDDQVGKVFEYSVTNNDGEVITKSKKLRQIGDKWAVMQTYFFNNNAQPYYVMLSPDADLLTRPVGYTPDVDEYYEWLQCGINSHRSMNDQAMLNPRQ